MGSTAGRHQKPEDLQAMIQTSELEWERISLDDPDGSLQGAEELMIAVEGLQRFHRGTAASFRAASHLLVGNLRQAEAGHYEAAALLDGFPAAAAENLRRMSVLRRTQRALEEARRLARQALELSRSHGSEEQVGKALLEVGNVHYDSGAFKDATEVYTESLRHLDPDRPTYIIATHNLTCATVMAGGRKELPDLARTVNRIRKALPRPSMVQTRLLWLQLITSIQTGLSNHAIKKLPTVVARLRKERAPIDDIGAANIDLAQAWWIAGEHEKACGALEDARSLLATIHNIDPEVVARLSDAISSFRSGSSRVEPWEIRRAMMSTASESRWRAPRSAEDDLQETVAFFTPGGARAGRSY